MSYVPTFMAYTVQLRKQIQMSIAHRRVNRYCIHCTVHAKTSLQRITLLYQRRDDLYKVVAELQYL